MGVRGRPPLCVAITGHTQSAVGAVLLPLVDDFVAGYGEHERSQLGLVKATEFQSLLPSLGRDVLHELVKVRRFP